MKIPRTPTDDDAGEAVPKYRNLWQYISTTLPKRSQAEDESHPLTDYLAEADGPLKQLAAAWEATFREWEAVGRRVPPVMIVIAHDTTVARLLEKHIADLGEASPDLVNPKNGPRVTVRIDSDALEKAEAGEGNGTAEATRQIVATVGKAGKPGEQVRCLISVNMLSEGWDARNVTQILGLRAFQSQLLCEQVVGRGLRRSQMGDLTEPEFVDVYGVPFQLLPMAKATGGKPVSRPSTRTSIRLPTGTPWHPVPPAGASRPGYPGQARHRPGRHRTDPHHATVRPHRDLHRTGPRRPARGHGRCDAGPDPCLRELPHPAAPVPGRCRAY